jgi:hypothetical protein
VARAPRLGYLVPPAYVEEIGGKLALHGIEARPFEGGEREAEVFRATRADFASRPFEGRMRVALEGEWKPERRRIPEGTLLVPVAQPRARLLVALLEQEHVEPYVAELIARDLLAADPRLGEEFRRRLEADPAFAADPAARLEFFVRRHACWDERLDLYPVFRV